VTGLLRAAVRAVSGALVALLVAVIRAYQLCIRPLFGPCCRFVPTCSEYAIEALKVHGVLWGLCLAAWRILRCNPYGGYGYDPVPPRRSRA
jgi:hypothetical protein